MLIGKKYIQDQKKIESKRIKNTEKDKQVKGGIGSVEVQ